MDFSKAYDMVPRNIVPSILKRMTVMVMLSALVAMHQVTESVIGTAIMTGSLRWACDRAPQHPASYL